MSVLLYTCRALTRGLGTQVPRSSTVLRARSLWPLSRVIRAAYSSSSDEHPPMFIGHPVLFKRALRGYATKATAGATKTTSAAKRPRAKKATTSGRAKPRRTAKKATGATTKKKAARKPTKRKTTAAKSKAGGRPKKTSTTTGGRKKRTKTVLTDEQKTKAKIRALKKLMLVEPKRLPYTVFIQVQTELARAAHGLQAKEASQRYKSLTPAELEHYNHIVNQNVVANDAAYKTWVESHTPDAIRVANNARRALNNLQANQKPGSPRSRKFPPIKDQRQPKRTTTQYTLFFTDRHRSGDFRHMPIPEAAKLIGREWRELSANDKEKYVQRAKADRSRYVQEYKTVFNRDSPMERQDNRRKAAASTTTTATRT
ncbi:MAG: hypothetical protein M1816_003766 [Peltula sp. TS41687]|nr:MAG: hypothetical protein M1816_003766 [Peltula sp. TS41687]